MVTAMKNNIVSYVQEDVGFYPTPPELVKKILEDVEWDFVSTVLEPSAGKGNIVFGILESMYDHSESDRIYSRGVFSRKSIDCVEIDPNLRSILTYTFMGGKANEYDDAVRKYREMSFSQMTDEDKDEQYRVSRLQSLYDSGIVRIVGDDFLNFITHRRYDLIVMNPPFNSGAEHLLKALKLQEENGGQIICILNAETIRNPFSNIRKVLMSKLNKYEATVQYMKNAFSSAERETDVEVAVVKVTVPGKPKESIFFESLKKAEKIKKEKQQCTELENTNPIQQMIDQYNFEVKATLRLIREYEAIKPLILNKLPYGDTEKERQESMEYTEAIITLTMAYGERSYGQGVDVNEYLKAVRMKYWYCFFKNDQFTGKLTSNLREEFESKVEEMADYDFSMFNIQQVLKRIADSLVSGVEATILSIFDKLSAEHSYYPECKSNIHFYNGWKSNKAHFINKKVIIPIYGCFAYDNWYRKYEDTISVSNIYSVLSDIEKALNYLDNCETEEINLLEVLKAAQNRSVSKKIACKYFLVTFFKKGTCHIEFTNERLLDKLNIFGSQHKNWLPPNYGKKHYSEMTDEEKAVVDEFQGAEKYEKIMREPAYYLSENTQFLMLQS